MKKALALAGGALMAVSVVGTASAASAQGDDGRDRRDRGSCTVELDQQGRRGNDLEVSVDGPRRADNAFVRLEFQRDRGRDVRRFLTIDLDRRGNGDETVAIPRRADSVDAAVFIRDGRRGFIRCDASLDLDRRGGRGEV